MAKKKIIKKKVTSKISQTRAPAAGKSSLTKYVVPDDGPLNLMVASTVYSFGDQLTQLCGILSAYGYNVINSHIGTVRVPHGRNNTQACLDAVSQCHVFLGIIRPHYSSGITHKEIKEAIRLNRPRWFVTHSYVTFSRQLFRQYRWDSKKKEAIPLTIPFAKTPVMDSLRVIDMYEDAINVGGDIDQRRWAQEFFSFSELLKFVETNFRDHEWIRKQCKIGVTP